MIPNCEYFHRGEFLDGQPVYLTDTGLAVISCPECKKDIYFKLCKDENGDWEMCDRFSPRFYRLVLCPPPFRASKINSYRRNFEPPKTEAGFQVDVNSVLGMRVKFEPDSLYIQNN